jgi:hypothetical protein
MFPWSDHGAGAKQQPNHALHAPPLDQSNATDPIHRMSSTEHFADMDFAVCRPAVHSPQLANAWRVRLTGTG